MTLQIHREVEQGSDEWLQLRRGIVTASTVGQLITKGSPDPLTIPCTRCSAPADSPCISTVRKVPTAIKSIHDERSTTASELPPIYRPAVTDTSRALTAKLVAERITGHVEPVIPNRSMIRGNLDEPFARDVYAEHYAPVEEVAFMVNDDWDYSIGYSPDGLVGEDGLIEIKSRDQKTQLQTVLADEVPLANMAQLQTGLLVSGRDWIDYVSYSSGMPLYVIRVTPDARWFQAIAEAVELFELNAADMIRKYETATEGMPATERIDHFAELEIVF